MNKNSVIALLACSTVVLGVLALRRTSRDPALPTGVQEKLVEPPAQPASLRQDAGDAATLTAVPDAEAGELATAKAENERLEKLVRDLQSEVSIRNARRTPAPSASIDAANLPQASQRGLAELLGNKETVGMAMDWFKADQSRRYASLIALANLDGPKAGQLRDLLAERYATRLDVAAAGLQSVTAEQRQQLDSDHQTRIEQLVGTDIAALFDKAGAKPVSFECIQRLEDRLRYEAQPLTREQNLRLWNLMSSQVFYTQAPQSEADIQALLQRRIDGAATIAENAKEVLNSSQLAVLNSLLQNDLATARVQTYRVTQTIRARQQQQAQRNTSPFAAPRPTP